MLFSFITTSAKVLTPVRSFRLIYVCHAEKLLRFIHLDPITMARSIKFY